nr:PREDICTED: transmembrane protein 171 [Latimeria chalumnae]|eukprot:XP_014345571.1 PREDICTED: transmembrane protein 171 [Latimeria chalumnae]
MMHGDHCLALSKVVNKENRFLKRRLEIVKNQHCGANLLILGLLEDKEQLNLLLFLEEWISKMLDIDVEEDPILEGAYRISLTKGINKDQKRAIIVKLTSERQGPGSEFTRRGFVMIPVVTTAPQMAESGGPTNKCGFFLCTFGAVCVSVGIFLLILGFWSCHPEELGSCYMVLKIGGPSLAAFGVGSIILARFKTRLYLRRRQLEDEQVDLDTFLFCGENRPFSCLVITGFLCLIGGILITLIKFLVPGCEVVLQNQFINGKLPPNVESRVCGFLPMQILGAAIAFLGLCFFVVACFKRRQAPSGTQENLSVMEDGGFQASESFQVVVGHRLQNCTEGPAFQTSTLSTPFLYLTDLLRSQLLKDFHQKYLQGVKGKEKREQIHLPRRSLGPIIEIVLKNFTSLDGGPADEHATIQPQSADLSGFCWKGLNVLRMRTFFGKHEVSLEENFKKGTQKELPL